MIDKPITGPLNDKYSLLEEMEKREIKRKNLIIFGVPEKVINDPIKNTTDSNVSSYTLNLLKKIVHPEVLPKIKFSRIGKISQDSQKIRPLKIVCENPQVAGNLRDCFLTKIKHKELLSALNIQNIWVTIDRTRLQQDQIKSLKTELHARQQAGEENLKLVYWSNTPRIVAKNDSSS